MSKAQAGDPVKTLRKVGLKTSTPDLWSDTVSESGSSGVGKWKGVSYNVNTTQRVQKIVFRIEIEGHQGIAVTARIIIES